MGEVLATDSALGRIDTAIDDVIEECDFDNMSREEIRGIQFDHGLAWIHFDEGHGGLGLRPDLQGHIEQRLRAAGAPAQDPSTFFLALAGPTVHTHGTDAQKRRFLRPMFTGEDRWCQLFSEPGAGSDFAGLGSKAAKDGDEWIVSGQKVWNTLAHAADLGMLVTRSNSEVPKHRGMTYFALDMNSPGVEVRPLRQITGEAEFNEVYMTDVRVPDADRLGDVGDGWRVSLTTLMNERSAIGSAGSPKRGSGAIASLVDTWNDAPEYARTPIARDHMMRLWARAETLRLTNMRASQNRTAGNPGPEMSVAKLAFASLNQEIMEAAINLEGPGGQVDFDYTYRRPEDLSVSGAESGTHHAFLRVRANSIEGGTSEIMRNIVGEQVLGLPGEPRVDKEPPWSRVPRS
ncbi:MAG: acyl-CoA dehydrogenase [Actinomycetia bacterium]|nr:acyl-CoA dehydrogenase [Actinomycetes bacterium]